jgi:4-amino-4-deoxy-L-arabinose transferase-like glycosyltransferase
VQLDGEICTAVFPERHDLTRTSSVRCPNLHGGFAGLYFSNASRNGWRDMGPLDWLFPRSGWRTVIFTELRGQGRRLGINVAGDVPGWRRVWGEWRPLAPTADMRWQTPIYGDYLVTAKLRRPEEQAGILLLEADGENGWAFITDPNSRRGVWWQWQNGEPGEPLAGIPYQKPFLAQGQSLLRRILRTHQGALLLLLAGWLLVKLGRGFRRLNPGFLNAFPSPSSWQVSPRHYKTAVLAIAFLLFVAAAYIATHVLERIPHVQDSITYLFQAQLLAKGKLWANVPAMPDFFAQEFLTVRNGRWSGQYPPGFPAVLAAGVLLGQPWLVNPILAALTMILLTLLGKALYGRSTTLIALILALTSPFLLFMSGGLMAHPAELFWVTAFMLSWTYALRRDGRRWTLLAGFALGMIALTRPATTVAAALPFLIVMGMGEWFNHKRRKGVVVKLGWLLVTAVPLFALLFLYQNALTGDPFREPRLLARPFDRIGFGLEIGESPNAFQLERIGEDLIVDWYFDAQQPPRGHTPARGIYNTEQNWRTLGIMQFGWLPLFTLAFIWLAFLTQRPSSADFALLAVFAGTVMVYVFYWSDGIMYGPRYYYGALPALFLLTSRGIQAAAQWFGREGQTAVAFLVAALIAGNVLFTLPAFLDFYQDYNFVSGQERIQVEQIVDEPAIIFVEHNPLNWWEYGRFFSGNTPWLDGPIIYARDLGLTQNIHLRSHFPNRQAYLWQIDEQALQPLPDGP